MCPASTILMRKNIWILIKLPGQHLVTFRASLPAHRPCPPTHPLGWTPHLLPRRPAQWLAWLSVLLTHAKEAMQFAGMANQFGVQAHTHKS